MFVRTLTRFGLLAALLIGAVLLLLPTTAALASDEVDVLALVNQHRAANGLSPLCLNNLLNQAAFAHSQDMLTNNYFDHTGLNGSQPWDRIRATGYKGSYFAENIAMGYQNAAEVFEGWRTSPGHNANMLSPDATEMGLARVGDYWTQVFGNGRPCAETSVTPIERDNPPVIVEPPVIEAPVIEAPASDPVIVVPDVTLPAVPEETWTDHGGETWTETDTFEDTWFSDMTEAGYICTTTTWVDEFGVTWECTTCVSG